MSLAINNISPIRPDLQVVESRVADLEDGYTRTANELLEAVMLSGLTQHHLLIVLAVWRKTYGYNKKMDWIGNEQFEALTGMAATKCSTAKNELIRMQVLVQQGRQVGMNKAISEWKTKINGFGKTFTESVKKSFPKSVKSDLPKRSNTKDNTTKDKKDNSNNPPKSPPGETKKFDPLSIPIPEWLNPQSWAEWVTYRSQSKKPIKTALTVNKAFKLLKECLDEGHDPAEVINTSIANGYQGLFKPKGPPRGQRVTEETPHWNSREGWEDFL